MNERFWDIACRKVSGFSVYWSLTLKPDGVMKKWVELITVVMDEFMETKCGVDNMEF